MSNSEMLKTLRSTRELNITVKGRSSGREVSLPVWFVLEGTRVHLLPVQGSSTKWYRNVLIHPTIKVSAKGAEVSVRAKPVTESQRVKEVADMFKVKYGSGDVGKYYSKFDVCVEFNL